MRCMSCNTALSDYESTRKYKGTESYIDLCCDCFNNSDLANMPVTDRPDLDNIINHTDMEV